MRFGIQISKFVVNSSTGIRDISSHKMAMEHVILHLVAYPGDKSKALLLRYIWYCTLATYSYINAIHNCGVGCSLHIIIAQMRINVYVSRFAHLRIKRVCYRYFSAVYKLCMFLVVM